MRKIIGASLVTLAFSGGAHAQVDPFETKLPKIAKDSGEYFRAGACQVSVNLLGVYQEAWSNGDTTWLTEEMKDAGRLIASGDSDRMTKGALYQYLVMKAMSLPKDAKDGELDAVKDAFFRGCLTGDLR